MLKPKEHFHGSDLEKIEEIYHIRKEEIIQFGANVNPYGLSMKLRNMLADHLDVITGYPDRDYVKLRQTIGEYCHCSPDSVIVGNGSTELISLTITLNSPKEAIIISPAYSEYEREIALCNGKVTYFPLRMEADFGLDIQSLLQAITPQTDLLVICNPNNPTSTVLHNMEMRCILERCTETDTFVMVDETYVEFANDYEIVTSVPLTVDYPNLIVLRGISKFFAAPGLRLGYGITGNSELRKQMLERQNPWSINSLAEVAARLMLTDTDYINATNQLIEKERSRITTRLSQIPHLKVYEPHANFVLVLITDNMHSADELFDACIRHKMMIRDCSTFHYLDEHFFRFCFMMPKDNERLLNCIEQYMTQSK